jgi:hypothetical protein
MEGMHLKGINVLRNILIGLSLMSVVADVSADHGIGFVVGSTYGYGIGYNRYLDNGYGWQISGFPYVEEDYRNLNLGLTVFKTLHEGKSGRPFLSLGAVIHHQYEKDEWEEILYSEEPPVPRQHIQHIYVEETSILAFGPGIGLEWKFFQNFTFSIGIPMAIFLESHKDRFEGGQNEDEFKFAIRPYPNVALMYRW